MGQYRIKEHAPPHFIGGRIHGPGDIVVLPEGVEAGLWLEPVGEAAPAVKTKGKGAKAPEPAVPASPAEPPVDPTEGEF